MIPEGRNTVRVWTSEMGKGKKALGGELMSRLMLRATEVQFPWRPGGDGIATVLDLPFHQG